VACVNLFEICSYESGGLRTERHLDQLKDCIVEQGWHYTPIIVNISSILQFFLHLFFNCPEAIGKLA
jgi:hypothetical protein